MTNYLAWAGAVVGSMFLIWGTWDYYHRTLRGSIQPHLITFLVWFVAPMIAFGFTLYETKMLQPEAILTFMVGACPGVILIALWQKGNLALGWQDWLCLGISAAALVSWWFTKNGNWGILFAILADLVAAAPTLKKSFYEPRTESPRFFGTFIVSSGITLLFVGLKGEWTVASCAFAIYLIVLYTTLYVLVKTRMGERLHQSRPSQLEVTPGT